ncbi:hypothetical protein TRIUR3_17895 [Triticum urartu]|uniref:Uncharacterized protein n=1 Tax=Triticum urartu TaxID=4572 RepID=M8A952_TRIUA|nr:hypothetical protein TRIUR3_17895 [Triticum urartu]
MPRPGCGRGDKSGDGGGQAMRESELPTHARVAKAADTDISALVEIEKNSRHRFEFFMDLVGDQPICACTAWACMKSGGRISHALSVYSCQLRHPNQSYHHIPLTPDNVVVFASRDVAIENALQLFSPALAIVDEHLTRHLPKQWLTSLAIEARTDCNHAEGTVTVIEAPRQSDLLIELIWKLKPQVVVTGMAQFEAITSAAFENLLNATKDVGSPVIPGYFRASRVV